MRNYSAGPARAAAGSALREEYDQGVAGQVQHGGPGDAAALFPDWHVDGGGPRHGGGAQVDIQSNR
jgi:hypothetical protein